LRCLSQTLLAAAGRLFVRSERADSAPFALVTALFFQRNGISKLPENSVQNSYNSDRQRRSVHESGSESQGFAAYFDRVCEENGIEHRLTLPAHPWTNGQVERMNKTIKEATVHRYYYESQTALQEHLQAFIDVYNFAKRLKSLNGLTPWEFIVKEWKSEPKLFKTKPNPYNMGLNI